VQILRGGHHRRTVNAAFVTGPRLAGASGLQQRSELVRNTRPQRQALPHGTPPWVDFDAVYLVTACTTPRHRNQLAIHAVVDDLRCSFHLPDEQAEWSLIAWVVMPDHVQVLATIPPGVRIPLLVGRWKRLTARRHGVCWQRDFFEHRLRSHEHVDAKREYLRQNPVRAGLVEHPDDWPFFWSAW